MAKYRAQILLEPEQHRALAEMALREDKSLSEVMREILSQYFQEQSVRRSQAQEALERLTRIREKNEQAHGVYAGDLLADVRAERERQIERAWRGD